MQVSNTRRVWSPVDRAVLALVRLVYDDLWSDTEAAFELRRLGHDDRTLELARARVAAAQIERPSAYGDRAIATLNAALAASALDEMPS